MAKCGTCGTEYDSSTQGLFCPHAAFAIKPEPRKQMVRLVVSTGQWFDMDMPEGFNMFAFATSIRATGYLINEQVYVPAQFITSVFTYFKDTPPEDKSGVVVQFPGKPA